MAGQPADPDDLPPPTARFRQHLADSVGTPPGVEADVVTFRVLNGDVRPFDEPVYFSPGLPEQLADLISVDTGPSRRAARPCR